MAAGRAVPVPAGERVPGRLGEVAGSTEAIQIVGRRWAARSHELRDILARVGIPFGFYPDDSPDGRRLLEQAGEDGSRLPVVLFRRGLVLVDPTHAELTRASACAPARPAAAATS